VISSLESLAIGMLRARACFSITPLKAAMRFEVTTGLGWVLKKGLLVRSGMSAITKNEEMLSRTSLKKRAQFFFKIRWILTVDKIVRSGPDGDKVRFYLPARRQL
jgi:hypothetical protein